MKPCAIVVPQPGNESVDTPLFLKNVGVGDRDLWFWFTQCDGGRRTAAFRRIGMYFRNPARNYPSHLYKATSIEYKAASEDSGGNSGGN